MPQRAHVTSFEAIKTFRSNLIGYMTKARPSLEEVSSEVTRTRLWLQGDRRSHWEGEARKRQRKLDEAKAELFSSKLSQTRDVGMAQQAAVLKAKRALEEAEAKLKVIKQWDRDYENKTSPLVKQMEKLQTLLSGDLPIAVAYLTQMLDTLEAYAKIAAPSEAPVPLPSALPAGASKEEKP
jgi:hypothetical protein